MEDSIICFFVGKGKKEDQKDVQENVNRGYSQEAHG